MFEDLAVFIVAAWIISFILLCLGLLFLFFGDNNSLPLIISALIFFLAIVFMAIKFADTDVLSIVGYFSIPFGIFAAVFDSIRLLQYFFIVIGLIINYLSVFAVISLITQIFRKLFNS